MEIREIASGLEFPEGPVAMPDGSVIVVEIHRGTLSRVTPEGKIEVIAELGGGPNGAAIGPDGDVYVCNDGGFIWTTFGDWLIPLDVSTGASEPPDFTGGWIEKVNPVTGAVTRLYSECDGHVFRSPNDIVFDSNGGFWFTDLGKTRPRDMDRGGLYYAQPDGSSVVEAAFGLMGPNGVGLSPDGNTVYVAESFTGHLVAWDIEGPGQLGKGAVGHGGRVVAATKGHFDSLAVEEDGNIVVAALPEGLCVITPHGAFDYEAFPDPMTTNVCFGGPDRRTAFVTLSASGKLVAADWPRAGLELAFGGP